MSCAVIGGGYWGKNIIRDLYSLNSLKIICDNNRESLQSYKEKYPNVKLIDNIESLWSQDFDVLCIALPSELHYSIALKALEMNKDVYVEKPFTLSLKDAEHLQRVAEEKNKIVMVGHILNYHPHFLYIKQLLSENKIGKLHTVFSKRLNLGIFRTQEDAVWTLATHDISFISNLFDEEPIEVFCHGSEHITKGVIDQATCHLRYRNFNAEIKVSWLYPYKEQKMVFVGDRGMIVFDDVEKKISFVKEYRDIQSSFPTALPLSTEILPLPQPGNYIETSESPLMCEMRALLNAVRTRNKPVTDINDGIRTVKILENLSQSYLQKKWISLEEQPYFVHPTAIVDKGAIIGKGTKIWHYTHVCSGARIGKNCNIGQNCYISSNAILGDYCKVQNNISIYDGVIAEDHVFFGPSCVLTNDRHPRASEKDWKVTPTILKKGCSLGANCTIVCGNTIGKYSMVGAGSTVTRDVDSFTLVVGSPAHPLYKIDKNGKRILT